MLKIFKQNLLNRNKVGRYLSYAAGEVVLIVIGILVAVSINNWNEERQQRKILNGIFTVLINDIRQDTAEVNEILDFYNEKKSTFLKIAHGSLTKNELNECDLCPTLLSSRKLFYINQRGIHQLNEFYDHTLSNQDTLFFHIVNFYSALTDDIEEMNDLINNDVMGNLSYWRDHYPWFASSMQGKLREDGWNYFGTQEYKNKVALHYVLIYENYLTFLEAFQKDAEAILKALNERLKDDQ